MGLWDYFSRLRKRQREQQEQAQARIREQQQAKIREQVEAQKKAREFQKMLDQQRKIREAQQARLAAIAAAAAKANKKRLAAEAEQRRIAAEIEAALMRKQQMANSIVNRDMQTSRSNIPGNNGANYSTAVAGHTYTENFTSGNTDESTQSSSMSQTLSNLRDNYINIYNKMPVIEGLDIMETENVMLAKLLQFNEKYIRYIHCNNSNVNSDCSRTEKSTLESELTTLYNDIDKNINGTIARDGVNGILTQINSIPNASNISAAAYETKYDDIKERHNDILTMRQDLDIKLKDLYGTEDSIGNMHKQQLDSTIYTEILLTSLATALLYYIFTEL
jgi:hypothetical protein